MAMRAPPGGTTINGKHYRGGQFIPDSVLQGMGGATLDWGGTDQQVLNNMDRYRDRGLWAVKQVALYWAPVLEAYAKQNAQWTDRTGNARQALRGYVDGQAPGKFGTPDASAYPDAENLARDTVAIFLSHGMNYGLYLEVSLQGRYAIIWPAIQEHVPAIRRMLQGIFG